MLLLSVWAVVLSATLEISHGFYIESPMTEMEPMCATPSKPCRLRVTMSDTDGSHLETIGTSTCTCSYPNTCPQDWDTPLHVVSRRIVSTTYNMTLQMMFCIPVVPKDYCGEEETSLIVKGAMAMPQDISSYNCQCFPGQPLVLEKRSIGLDNLIYHSYACAYHVTMCFRTEACMVMNQTTTDYPCQCPRGFFCRIPDELWGIESSYGFCRP